jgi:hypothetical protein
MNTLEKRLLSWKQYDAARTEEAERRAFLSQTPTPNPPHLYTPTKIKVVRAFHGNGRVLEVGEVVTVPRTVATGAIGANKAVLSE